MQVTSKGQVTIPVEIRERLGILPNSEVEFEVVGDAVVIRKASGARRRGRSVVSRMKGKATVTMTTDEILELTRGAA
jgi:AbrB family looped-hinge helix DNA binding protein